MTEKQDEAVERTNGLIESVRDVEDSVLEAVRRFVDTVNGAFPDVSEDGPRSRIIDSAFKMTEQLVGASTEFAEKIVKTASSAPKRTGSSSK
jgi:hypothetical protein